MRDESSPTGRPFEIIRYCSACGAAMASGAARHPVCEACGRIHYRNPLPVASALVANDARELLLVKRGQDPFKGMWCLPIGFAEIGEGIQAAALRELQEEAGVEGEIVRLLDAASHDNPVYGDLLIVTFEVHKTGGEEQAGDDAEDVGYFPISDLPRLAFDEQRAAVARFLEAHEDEWRILDSVRHFTDPEVEDLPEEAMSAATDRLSDELLDAVEASREQIVARWLADLSASPATPSYHAVDPDLMSARAIGVLGAFGAWMRDEHQRIELDESFAAMGRARRKAGVPVHELIASFIIFKKHLWTEAVSHGAMRRVIDVVRLLELDRRVAAFFDRAIYQVSRAYAQNEGGES